MIDFLKGTVGKDYFSDRLYGCQECIAEYLASKEPLSQPTNQSFTNRFIESRIIWIGSTGQSGCCAAEVLIVRQVGSMDARSV